jgi:hypothetical protein
LLPPAPSCLSPTNVSTVFFLFPCYCQLLLDPLPLLSCLLVSKSFFPHPPSFLSYGGLYVVLFVYCWDKWRENEWLFFSLSSFM